MYNGLFEENEKMDYKEMISALEGYFEGKDLKRGDALRIADGINTFLAERNAVEWISVQEKLPPKCTNKVIVSCKNGYVGFGHYENYNGVQTWFNLESGKPFSEWAYDDPDDYDVTHWMPLPEHFKENN